MVKSDHKRTSRPIAPAEVRCGDGWIEVIVPDVLGKNESHTAGKGGARHTSAATKRYRQSFLDGVINFRAGCPSFALREQTVIWSGAWRLEVLGVWPRKRDAIAGRDLGFGLHPCPLGDADAAVPQALDALQHAGILDDDARVVEVSAWNLYRKGVRCTVIRLVRVPDLAVRDAEVAHLAALVPAEVEPQPKPKRTGRKDKP